MVYYLKYRPQNLEELDNRRVADAISRHLSRRVIPHAFLFTGPKGTGKTSTARIIAKSINCLQKEKLNQACGKCNVCFTIARGENLDILEIDAASNRGIDEIRDLREKIKLTPLSLKYKVYIIDEVHMLTSEAFNALLKTLEEPPSHVIFILATTELHKVPPTIISRCVHIDFHKATNDEILHSLNRIVKGENLQIEKEALHKISDLADGSFRDAAKILEDLSTYDQKITLELVNKQTQLHDVYLEAEFLKFLREKNAKELILIIKSLSDNGKNIRQFFMQILNKLNEQLLKTVTQNDTSWRLEDLKKALELFGEAFSGLKLAPIASLPFELAAVDYCYEESSHLQNIDSDEKKISPKEPKANLTVEATSQKWAKLLEILKPLNHSLVGVLRSCRPLKLDNHSVVIEAAYKFHAEKLNEAKTLGILDKAIRELLGQPVKIIIELKKRN